MLGNRDSVVFFENVFFSVGHCVGDSLFYLGNRDSSFNENSVSEDGDKNCGFETIQ
jgi:hypothetical protein